MKSNCLKEQLITAAFAGTPELSIRSELPESEWHRSRLFSAILQLDLQTITGSLPLNSEMLMCSIANVLLVKTCG